MIKFGPSGNSKSFYDEGNQHSEQVFEWLHQRGLNAYEYSFGRGINLGDAKAQIMHEQSEKYGVEISVHAPYYINFANPDEEMAQKSINYLLNSCRKLKTLGGNKIVFHAATVGKMSRNEAFGLCLTRIDALLKAIYDNAMQDFLFCPETMGKINQIGTIEEVAEICKLDKCLLPTVDFGHLNARSLGGLKTEDDFQRIIDVLADTLGDDKTRNMHVHFSKIEYSKGGEVKHLTFKDTVFGPQFEPLAKIIQKNGLSPTIICESDGTQAEDAITMKKIFYGLVQ